MEENELWKLAELASEISYPEEEEENHGCKHLNCEFEPKTSDKICYDCGMVFSTTHAGPEWNNYKDDCGNYSKNTQRADLYENDNPNAVGTCILQFKNNPLIMKLQYQAAFSHKQKTFWQIGTKMEHLAGVLHLGSACLSTAKDMWHKYMESGKLTRASVRAGLIASCLYYSCIHNNVPIEREEIIKVFECSSKCLSKGEKVICQILEKYPKYSYLVYTGINIDGNDAFIRYCSLLKLHFSVSNICLDIFTKNKIKLQAVTPKSAIGGVIAYVVKYELELKIPSKTTISKVVDVCTPTINKVISLIEK